MREKRRNEKEREKENRIAEIGIEKSFFDQMTRIR